MKDISAVVGADGLDRGPRRSAPVADPMLPSLYGREARGSSRPTRPQPIRLPRLMPFVAAISVTGLCTVVALVVREHVDLIVVAMIYMLGATLTALRLGQAPAFLASTANIVAFDFFFVPPLFSFAVADPRYSLTFAVMFTVATVIATRVSAMRQHAAAAAARERRTAELYAMSRKLGATSAAEVMVEVAEQHIGEVSSTSAVILVCDPNGTLRPRQSATRDHPDMSVCQWVVEHRQRAGLDSEHFSNEHAVYLPLVSAHGIRGVLVVRPSAARPRLLREHASLIEALAAQLSAALERARLAVAAETARVAAERAALRNTLLASISHDLRTPLSAIAGAGSMVADEDFPLDAHRRTTLGRLIVDKVRDMTQQLSNVLDLLRYEGGDAELKCSWQALPDLVGVALAQSEGRLTDWRVFVNMPADLPLVFVDESMIVRMLSNLIDNCMKYTPPETRITIEARLEGSAVIVIVEDDGPGLPPGDPERLFAKFERGAVESNIAGVGLGLAICRVVARLNGGDIRAERVTAGGARFEVSLPLRVATADLPGA